VARTSGGAQNFADPITTQGDLIYGNASGQPARLQVGAAGQLLQVAGGLPVWGAMPLVVVATTGENGYALVNGTGAILTWTAPNDGALHVAIVIAGAVAPGPAVGGAVGVMASPDGAHFTTTPLFNAALGTGTYEGSNGYPVTSIVAPGSTVTIEQTSAMTAGGVILYAVIMAV